MNIKAVLYYLGKINLILLFFSIINILYCVYFDYKLNLLSYFVTFSISCIFYFSSQRIVFKKDKLKTIDLVVFSALGWVIFPLIMSIPFWLGGYSNFLGSYFEITSGLTSFGATIFFGKDYLLDSPILLWRNSSQLIGSIYFVMTILLVLGNRELNILPIKFITKKRDSNFFHVNFDNTFFLTIYSFSILFLISLFFLNFTDLRLLEKFNLALTIISTGGFINDNLLISNDTEKYIISFLFVISSLNIFLILGFCKIVDNYNKKEDQIFLIIFSTFLIFLLLTNKQLDLSDLLILLASSFSNSGINFINYYNPSLTFVFLSSCFIGGCMISSTSGFKIVRILIIFNKIYNELIKLLAPSTVINTTVLSSKERISSNDFFISSGLLLSYILIFIIYSFILTLENLSFEDSFLTSVLITFNTLPSDLFLSENIDFSNFSNTTLALTILMLLVSKISPLSLIILIKYKFIK